MQTLRTGSLSLTLAVFLAGCGDSTTGPETTYEDISGSYAGVVTGLTQGIAMESDVSFTITQNQGELSGSWALSGIITDGVDFVEVQGTGTLSGTIAAGTNPSVNLTVRTSFCPDHAAEFSGAFDSANQRLTISGPIDMLNDACNVVLRYESTLILTR
jgi:hypothetical protein